MDISKEIFFFILELRGLSEGLVRGNQFQALTVWHEIFSGVFSKIADFLVFRGNKFKFKFREYVFQTLPLVINLRPSQASSGLVFAIRYLYITVQQGGVTSCLIVFKYRFYVRLHV